MIEQMSDNQQDLSGWGVEASHPSGDPGHSPTDRRQLLGSDFEVSCVQPGEITADPGAVTEHLRCVEEPSPPDLREPFPWMSVVVVDG